MTALVTNDAFFPTQLKLILRIPCQTLISYGLNTRLFFASNLVPSCCDPFGQHQGSLGCVAVGQRIVKGLGPVYTEVADPR